MPRVSDKRERLVEAAKELIYRQGFARTTLADIAEASSVPLGNVYYYFKTKDDIGAAVIAERRDDLGRMLASCGCAGDPRECLVSFLTALRDRADLVAERGCPVGSLCQELGKSSSPLTEQADEIVRFQLAWLTEQFERSGAEHAARRAARFLASVHGTFLAGQALGDPEFIREQVSDLIAEIEAL